MQFGLFVGDARTASGVSQGNSHYGSSENLNQRGSLSILVSGYLALLLTLFLSGTALALGLIAQNRIQGVADSAVLYAHDRAITRGVPDQDRLSNSVLHFLSIAPSAQQLDIRSVETKVVGVTSVIQLCAAHKDPMGWFSLGQICQISKAESFLVD